MATFFERARRWFGSVVRLPNSLRVLAVTAEDSAASILRLVAAIQRLDATLADLAARVDRLEANSGRLLDQNDSVRSEVAGLKSAFADLQAISIAQIIEHGNGLTIEIGAVKSALADLREGSLGQIIERGAALSIEVGVVKIALADLRENSLGRIIERANTLSMEISAVKAAVADLREISLGQIIERGNTLVVEVDALKSALGDTKRVIAETLKQHRGDMLAKHELDVAQLRIDIAREIDQSRSSLLARLETTANATASDGDGGNTVEAPLALRAPKAVMQQLARKYPRAYPIWKGLFDRGAAEYRAAPSVNLSVEGHAVADQFGKFILKHGRGRLLDIGCGPQPIPAYLIGYPIKQIAGCDPLPPESKHPFTFCHAVGEDLPWPDASFETIVLGTSLDHAINPVDVLGEVARLLVPGGRALIWVGFIKGARAYDPTAEPAAVDDYHMFHFDKSWFETLMGKQFELCDRINIAERNDWFYMYETPQRRRVPQT
jgi:SAM-dependent methyltransferase/regulator of replication initiation timing